MPSASTTPATVPPTPSRRRRATRRLFLRLCGSALGIGVAAPLEARYIEPYSIEVTRHQVFLPNLPESLNGLTVAQLTDLHRGPCTPDGTIRRAVAAAAALRPDAVVLTGDFVRWDVGDAAPLAKLLHPLEPRLGIWGCLGNHDYQAPDHLVRTLEQEAGVRFLRNSGQELTPGLWIAGIEDTVKGRPNVRAALAEVPDAAPAIFLTHNPVGVWNVTKRPYLVLSGHTHGGQICVPGMKPHFPPGMEGFPQIDGWGVYDSAKLYISRGVGMGMLPMRFCCPPEVALFTLHRGDEPPYQIPSGTSRAQDMAEHAVRAAAHRVAAIGRSKKA